MQKLASALRKKFHNSIFPWKLFSIHSSDPLPAFCTYDWLIACQKIIHKKRRSGATQKGLKLFLLRIDRGKICSPGKIAKCEIFKFIHFSPFRLSALYLLSASTLSHSRKNAFPEENISFHFIPSRCAFCELITRARRRWKRMKKMFAVLMREISAEKKLSSHAVAFSLQNFKTKRSKVGNCFAGEVEVY